MMQFRTVGLIGLLLMSSLVAVHAKTLTYQDARQAYDAAEYQRADQIWRQLANGGDLESMFALGALLYQGPGDYPVNYIESSEWYLKAASLGHADAQYNLGNAYQNGLGVWKDDQQAALWWRKAADQGLPKAAYNLGIQYVYGRGVEQDHDQALIWFRKAAARGHPGAREVLAASDFEIPVSEDDVTEVPAELVLRQPAETSAPSSLPDLADNAAGTSTPAAQASLQPETDTPAQADPPVTASETAESRAVTSTEVPSATSTENASEPETAGTRAQTTTAVDASPARETVQSVLKDPVVNTGAAVATSPTMEQLESRILELEEDHYTLQMTAMSEPDRINEYIRQHSLRGDLYRFRFLRDGVTLYGLSMGNFKTRDDAITYRDHLDQTRRNTRDWQAPWPRRVIDIQNLIQLRRISNPNP